MIRLAAYLLAVVLGLAAALIAQGRMHHLRLTLPAVLPVWTDQIAADAGLTAGSMHLTATGGALPLDLAWKIIAPGSDGLHWHLRITGPGVDVQARMTLRFALTRAQIDDVAGTVDLAKLGAAARDLGGIIKLTGLTLSLEDIWNTPRGSGSAKADWRGATYRDTDLGEGAVRAELDRTQNWRAWVDLEGGVSSIQAALSGQLPQPVATLSATIPDDPALPDSWRRTLELTGPKKQGAWEIRQTVPLRPADG